jgi:hypothetical protein
MAVRATPRMAALSPGASPPDVKIPKVFTAEFCMLELYQKKIFFVSREESSKEFYGRPRAADGL